MPLDPQVQALLEQMAAIGLPPLWTLSPEDARRQYLAARSPVPPEPVARVEDRMIPGADGDIPIRIYMPEGRAPFPALVYFHGGGWVIGNIETHDHLCRQLANRAGCVVISVDYRLAPEHKFPAAAEDAYAAACWVAAHAAELGIDPNRIAAGGDSAGGNLAAVVSLMARDRGGPPLIFQLLFNPVADFDFTTPSYEQNAEGYMLTRDAMVWFWSQYLPAEEHGRHPHASPLRAESLHGLPPALVITAEYDPLRDEGEAYAARLRDAGVPVTLSRYDGMPHNFMVMSALINRAHDAINEAAAALREAFAGAKV